MNYISLHIDVFYLAEDLVYTSDERRLWYPVLNSIFEENYFSTLTNNPYPGYGLFTSYVGSINTFILLGFKSFEYYIAINYLLMYLFFLFLYELSEEIKVFSYNLIIFIPLILSSHWFTYVFFGSLLSEGISSLCFGVMLTEVLNKNNSHKNRTVKSLIFLSIGCLVFTRQFISTIVLVFLVYLFIRKRDKIILLGAIPMFVKFMQSIFLPNTYLDPYINNEQLSDFVFNLNNFSKMILQFLIDKPVSYLYLMFLVLVVLNIKTQKKYLDYYLFFILNFVMVVCLMVFIWQKDDVQSSYRYIMNVFYLILYPMISMLNNSFSINK